MSNTSAIFMLTLVMLTSASLVGCNTDSGNRTTPQQDKSENRQPPIGNIDKPPVQTAADDRYADVYKPLDGTWKGKFNIYVDPRGQQSSPVKPTDLSDRFWQREPFTLSQTIDVQQVYESESPFFQRVRITDTYPDGRVVESRGVNKVQDGRMWCVVDKPDDKVIHEGSTDGPTTIIWSRDRKDPLSVEYFRETVQPDTYEIIGWGYYGNDDPGKAPRMFFSAVYQRVK